MSSWTDYYPGADYVDWFGYSQFGANYVPSGNEDIFSFARSVNKPVMIAEACWNDQAINAGTESAVWSQYFSNLFEAVERLPTQIKAISYINQEWSAFPGWQAIPFWDGTDSRIQQSTLITNNWETELADPRYINEDDDIHTLIRFNP